MVHNSQKAPSATINEVIDRYSKIKRRAARNKYIEREFGRRGLSTPTCAMSARPSPTPKEHRKPERSDPPAAEEVSTKRLALAVARPQASASKNG
jgi:hypothetical protein